ncbi:MAG TPA: hypothetical protein VK929_00640 [Longimicrobiales bacterium]|nr:hypothetical protein [Longimicrobiales bacterium]
MIFRSAAVPAFLLVASASGAVAQGSVFDKPSPEVLPIIVAPIDAGAAGTTGLAGAAGLPGPAGAAGTRGLPATWLEQERRGRQTWRFARYGALLGGAAGLTVGGLYALYCSGGAYNDCGSVWLGMTALGVVSGFVGGAIIGAAVPAPRPADGPGGPGADPARPPEEPAAGPVRTGRPGSAIGSGTVAAGLARASIADEGGSVMTGTGPVARLTVLAELRPSFALGPELGLGSFGDAGDVRHVAVAARVRSTGRVAPFGTVSLGAWDSTGPSLEYLGGSVGGGVRMEAGTRGRYFLEVDARHARNAQSIAPMRMWSLTVSGGLYW